MEKTALTVFDEEKKRAENAIELSVQFQEITSREQAKKAKDFSVGISKFIKLVDAKRKEVTRAERDEIKRVDNYVKDHIDVKKLDEISKRIINAVAQFDRREKEKQNQRQISSVSQRLDSLKHGMAIQTETKYEAPLAKTRDNWVYEVVDFSQLDDKYKTVDDAKIRELIKSGQRDVKGLKIYNDPIVIRS